ncbi:MAG: hypothetical protein OYG31_01460 [Candidatus Kaiserbacteria bacterium]|nr:hypothetical protein [Candidatus Kaiserbacteria bacterium]
MATKQKWMVSVFCMAGVLIFSAVPVFSHPGRTAADGCHYCRTNCERWGGAEYNQRHCHQSKGIPQPEEPIRSHQDGSFEVFEAYKEPEQKKDPIVSPPPVQENTQKEAGQKKESPPTSPPPVAESDPIPSIPATDQPTDHVQDSSSGGVSTSVVAVGFFVVVVLMIFILS